MDWEEEFLFIALLLKELRDRELNIYYISKSITNYLLVILHRSF
mgnify:CR=1 FL=1|jgi:hypothetical protein